ncbi:MAG: hypothetical protein RIK87_23030 [Fuerstiella sp.]
MNDSPEHTPKFSDDQMDQLLQVFYPQEIPDRLDQLPSSWPQLQAETSKSTAPAPPAKAPGRLTPLIDPVVPVRTSATRTIAMAATALAACLIVVVAASRFQSPHTSGTVQHEDSPGLQGPDLMNVSGSGQAGSNGVVGEDNTTLQEIDNIDLNPPAVPSADEPKRIQQQ